MKIITGKDIMELFAIDYQLLNSWVKAGRIEGPSERVGLSRIWSQEQFERMRPLAAKLKEARKAEEELRAQAAKTAAKTGKQKKAA